MIYWHFMSKVKRSFSSAVRQPYQDAIATVLKIIDYHNQQAREDFANAQFHTKQAMALKLWMIDMKEFIIRYEKEPIPIQTAKKKER